MSSKKPRGNPNFLLKRAQREGVDVSEFIRQQAQKSILKPHEAAHLVDKNSRTIAKIIQLLVSLKLEATRQHLRAMLMSLGNFAAA